MVIVLLQQPLGYAIFIAFQGKLVFGLKIMPLIAS
jgi:hypothetical protein